MYLNNAATSWPKVPGLGREVARATEEVPFHPGRSGFRANEDPMAGCRAALARLLGSGESQCIVLCQHATQALNLAIQGFPFALGDRVVTTALEHNSVLRPLFRLEKRGLIQLSIVPVNAEGRVEEDAFERTLHERPPRLVVVNHASNVTGAIQNVEALFREAHRLSAVTLLDASQTLGLVDVDVRRMGTDMVAFTGHKYLLGPVGTGGLYVSPNIELEPILVGGTGIRSDLRDMPPEMPGRLEAGTPNLPAFAGLRHALSWQEQNKPDRDQLDRLCRRLEDGLVNMGANVVQVTGNKTPVISLTLPGWDVEEVGYVLEKGYGICCRTGLHCAPLIHRYIGTAPTGSLRLSLSRFTTAAEADHVLGVFREFTGSRVGRRSLTGPKPAAVRRPCPTQSFRYERL
jgi:cysteine desulfurase/selenocysteine lyase